MQRNLRSVPIETNLIRKGLIKVGHGWSSIDSRDLLGTVHASSPVALTDLDILGWLSARLLRDESAVAFSREELAEDLFGRPPGGKERKLVWESLTRLSSVQFTLGGYDATRGKVDLDVAFGAIGILSALERTTAAGYAAPTWRAVFDDWLVNQLAHGYATYIDWATTRTLTGLQKRLWLYFEAEPRDSFWIALGSRGLTSLGLAHKTTAHAHRALRRVFPGLAEIPNHSYHASIYLSRVGYRLHGSRLSESRAADALFDEPEPVRTRKWKPLDGSKRRSQITFDPARSLIASKAPANSGSRRNAREAMVQRRRDDRPRLLLEGHLPRDQADLLVWMREEAHGLDRILVLVREPELDIGALHNPSCPDLDAALEDFPVDGFFVASDGAEPLERWCAQQRIRVPKWCSTCRSRFHDRSDAP